MSALKNIVEIILWGDSLTSIGSGYGEFFKYPGKITSDFGVGGENTLQILGRIGASPYLVYCLNPHGMETMLCRGQYMV